VEHCMSYTDIASLRAETSRLETYSYRGTKRLPLRDFEFLVSGPHGNDPSRFGGKNLTHCIGSIQTANQLVVIGRHVQASASIACNKHKPHALFRA
jgi:hypothetical protein